MTFFEETIISGFIGEAISRCVDFSWTKIKEVVKDKKNKYQNIESQIYNVIVNVLNQITYNKFVGDQDRIYQAAEKLIIEYKAGRGESIDAVRAGLRIFGESVDNDKYMEFKVLLYQEISKNDYAELYRQIKLLRQDEESSRTLRIEEKVNKVQQSVDETNRRLDAFKESNRVVDNVQNKKAVKSRTQEYADKWNKNMFLNDFDEWDENAGVNVKLKDVYIDKHIPHFTLKDGKKIYNNLDFFLSKHIMETNENEMLLILGQPGIGKSTLITWITVKYIKRINDILVYKFASDLKNIEWHNNSIDYNIADEILRELNISIGDLEGKILIIDGFDEISVGNNGINILNKLYLNLVKGGTLHKFSLIITCRQNYVEELFRSEFNYITLHPWEEGQIRSFCKVFQRKVHYSISSDRIISMIKRENVFGIPLILYMVLALNITIEKEGSIVDVYDKIFSLEGGIYDRCINYKRFADLHRISRIKKQIHQISEKIAIWIFENNFKEAYIPKDEYKYICGSVVKESGKESESIEQDFLIGSYFNKVRHCEGVETERLSFIHRTIYEYFVAEVIFCSIKDAMMDLTEKSQENLAGRIAIYLKKGEITYNIGVYIKYKIEKLYYNLNNKKQEQFYKWWERTVDKMMEFGMFYFTSNNVKDFQSIISKELRCFLNMMEILRLLMNFEKNDYILKYVNKKRVEKYIKYCAIKWKQEINLSYVFMVEMDLMGVDLSHKNLFKVNMTKANLIKANLCFANLKHAILKHANLYNANLEKADLTGANLERAILLEANLQEAVLLEANLQGTIWRIDDLKKVILQLQESKFDYLIVQDKIRQRKIYKSKLSSE